jgi:hypothetical protein
MRSKDWDTDLIGLVYLEERPYEDTARKKPSTHLEKSYHQKPNQSGP